jgi:hypothetical protein
MVYFNWFKFSYKIEGSRDCASTSHTVYPLLYTIYNLVITIGPFFIVILFGSLVFNNLRQVRRGRVIYLTKTNENISSTDTGQRFQRNDIHFIKLSFIQVIQSTVKYDERPAIDSVISTIGLSISYLYISVILY